MRITYNLLERKVNDYLDRNSDVSISTITEDIVIAKRMHIITANQEEGLLAKLEESIYEKD